jgi:hypothetical protein
MTTQLAHLHPRYCVVKPPISGPSTGPFIGPIDQILNAVARYLSEITSPTVPGALAIIAAPAQAPKKRTIMIVTMPCASAQGIMRITKKNIAMAYTGFLPYVSDIGARTRLPTAKPIRYVVTPRVVMASSVTPNSLFMASMAAV